MNFNFTEFNWVLLSIAEFCWELLRTKFFVDHFKHCDLCQTKIKTFQKRNTKSFPIYEVKRRKRDIAKGSQESCSLYKRSYRFETGPEGWNCWWFSNYGRRVVFLWVSTYPQDPYDFSHTLLLLRKKEKITQFLSYFPKYYWHKNVLHCQSSHVFLLLNLSVYLLNVHKISAKSCVTRQNDGWYACSLTVTKFQNFPKNS